MTPRSESTVQDSRILIEDYLASATQLLETAREIKQALRRMTEMLVPEMADWCVPGAVDEAGRWYPVAALHRDAEKQNLVADYAEHAPVSGVENLEQTAARERTPRAIREITAETLEQVVSGDERYLHLIGALEAASLMSVPLVARTRLVGFMTLASTSAEGGYSDEDLQIAYTFALALDNAQLFEGAQKIRLRLQLAYDITAMLLKHPAIEDVGGELLRRLGEDLEWDVGALWTWEPNNQGMRLTGTWHSGHFSPQRVEALDSDLGYRAGQAPTNGSRATVRADWIEDLSGYPRSDFPRAEEAKKAGVRGALFLPLVSSSGAAGVLELLSLDPKARDEDELAALVVLSTLVGGVMALEGSVLELSTLVLQLSERLLLFPLIGTLDPGRMARLTQVVLRAVRQHRARAVLLDVTGVPSIDPAGAASLLEIIAASKMLGAVAVVTGVSPESAKALVETGVNLGEFTIAGNL